MKAYEIAYLIDSSISPEEAISFAGKITKIIEDIGGTIQFVSEPKKRKLSFFVGKQGHAYFGHTNFSLEPKKVSDLRKKLSEEKHILRLLIVEALKANPNLRERPVEFNRPSEVSVRKVESAFRGPKAGAAPEGQSAEKVNIEEIDKRLDEILNK